MTTWTVVDPHEGIVTHISDAGRQKYEDEQRIQRVDRLYADIKIGSICGALIVIAALVIKHILGV